MVKETEMQVRVAIKGSGVGGCKERGWASSKGGTWMQGRGCDVKG